MKAENLNQDPRIAIGIATAGRRQQLSLTLRELDKQTVPPERVFICPASPEDFDEVESQQLGLQVSRVVGKRGSCAQRNAIFTAVSDCDILLFIDDDFYPAEDYLSALAAIFSEHEDVAIVTTYPEHDGATGPGLVHEQAVQLLATRVGRTNERASKVVDTFGGYGCNMAVRLSIVEKHGIRFDENLPLYGWLEDLDFSRQVALYGRVVTCSALYGVHLGSKNGKTSGVRLGYSQIANPIYLMRKGSVAWWWAGRQMSRNLAKNLFRWTHPEPWVDRRGRLKGNYLALRDLALGQVDPRRILEL